MSNESMENVLYYGDNLDILRRYIKDESVDLVYLDPPFKSQQDYNVLFAERDGSKASAQIKAFEDTWQWDQSAAAAYENVVSMGGKISDAMTAMWKFLGPSDMMAYLAMMAPRLIELRRVLKPSGSIYLHCDSTASHYLKFLMDAIFGPEHYRNEIIWRRTNAHNNAGQFGRIHDTILFYTKGDDYYFNTVKRPYFKKYVEGNYRHTDDKGPYQRGDLTGSGTRKGESGETWMGYDVTAAGRHWAIPKIAYDGLEDDISKLTLLEKLDYLNSKGMVYVPDKEGGQPRFVRYLQQDGGNILQDIWAYQPYTEGLLYGSDEAIDQDVKWLTSKDMERLGYPTQKPEGLLARIINASCPEGGVVLDPFCGCGTTIVVAEKLERKWVGIDITHLSISLMRHRLEDAFPGKRDYKVIGEPVTLTDAEALAATDPYQFQWWALGLVGARPVEQKKGADKGVDGRLIYFTENGNPEQIIFSVKAGNVTVSHVRDLRGVVQRERAAIGVLLSMHEPTAPMRAEAASAGFYISKELGNLRYPKIQLLTIQDLLDGKRVDCPHAVRSSERNVTFKKAPVSRKQKRTDQKQTQLEI